MKTATLRSWFPSWLVTFRPHTLNASAVLFIAGALLLGSGGPSRAQTTPEDGNWADKHAALTNTPQAAFMARTGDIDNMGFGWPAEFDPFSGNSTPAHGFPWTADPADPAGTDRIMVVGSYNGNPPCSQDGYTSTTDRPDNTVRPIVLSYSLPALRVTNAVLQIFVDDFQAPVWCANYQVTINNRRAAFLEGVINSLDQTGPIGKLITVNVPPAFLGDVASGRLELVFDDLTTGSGDGYSIDFVKLLVNTKQLASGGVSGYVLDAGTGGPIVGATVSAFGLSAATNPNGFYSLEGVPAGLAFLEASADGYAPTNQFADVIANKVTSDVNFSLSRSLVLSIAPAVQLRFFALAGLEYTLQYSSDLAAWTDDERITGAGAEVIRYRLADADHRFWQVKQP